MISMLSQNCSYLSLKLPWLVCIIPLHVSFHYIRNRLLLITMSLIHRFAQVSFLIQISRNLSLPTKCNAVLVFHATSNFPRPYVTYTCSWETFVTPSSALKDAFVINLDTVFNFRTIDLADYSLLPNGLVFVQNTYSSFLPSTTE